MPIMRPILLALILLGLTITGCTRSTEPPHAPAPTTPADVAATSCTPPQRSCLSCDGSRRFCARFCPECPALLAPGGEAVPATLALLREPACADSI